MLVVVTNLVLPNLPEHSRLVGTRGFCDIVGSAIDSGDHTRHAVMASTAGTAAQKRHFVVNFQHRSIIAKVDFIVNLCRLRPDQFLADQLDCFLAVLSPQVLAHELLNAAGVSTRGRDHFAHVGRALVRSVVYFHF